MAPTSSRLTGLSVSTDASSNRVTTVAEEGSSLVRPLAISALCFTVLAGAAYAFFRFYHAKDGVKDASSREPILPSRLDRKKSNSKTVDDVQDVTSVSQSAVVEINDSEAQCAHPRVGEPTEHHTAEVGNESSSDTTPSLCDDSGSPKLHSCSIPNSLFDLDNLLATPMGTLATLAPSAEPLNTKRQSIEIDDILEEYYAQSSSLLSLGDLGQADLVGLGISMPIIVLDGCETRIDPPTDVNFDADAPQSPVMVVADPHVEYLDVPPAQHCARERQQAKASAAARARIRRLSTCNAVSALRIDKKSGGVRTFMNGGFTIVAPTPFAPKMKVDFSRWF